MKLTVSLMVLTLMWHYAPQCQGANILFFTPLGSKSHKIFYMGFIEPLAQKGHQITIVSSFKPSKETKNIREVIIDFDMDVLLTSAFNDTNSIPKNLFFDMPFYCSDTLAQKQVQDLKKEKFDLIILSMFFDYCYLSFVHHFQVPFIYTLPAGLFGPFSEVMNNFELTSVTPNKLIEPVFPPTFTQRLSNQIANIILSLASHYYLEPQTIKVCKERGLCPPDMPSLREISNGVSLAIINSVKTLEFPPRPAMPNIIYAGGVHIKPPQELPKDLEKWIAGAGEHGFIFFSLGSALNPAFLPEGYRKILIKVFGSLKQRVLWKWDQESMPDLPSNVKLSKWLPQQDILGHPSLRLFITHGGLLSTQESMYNGIPVLGMPVFADQFGNMREVESEGWGKVMNWKELEEVKLRSLITELVENKKYRVIAEQRSSLMKDVPVPPQEEAAFWIEYVLRHKGAEHLKSPIRFLRWYEVYNLDVWAFLIGLTLVLGYVLWSLLKMCLRICGFLKPSSSVSSSSSSRKKKRE